MKEIRLTLQGKDVEKFEIIKSWYHEKTDTGVLRNLITEKYQEIKKFKLLGKREGNPSEKIKNIIREEII